MDRIVRFGDYELNRRTGELRKHGVIVRLQGKPSQVLMKLIERPGETVTREELQQCLWSQDTFVDFQSGLNTAVNRLRVTLGDSPEHPRYVETLARSGYRFVATVHEVVSEIRVAEEPPLTPTLPTPERPTTTRRRWIVALACALAASAAALYWIPRHRNSDARVQQITFRRGVVSNARFAPGGQSVLYSAQWDLEPFRIYSTNLFQPGNENLGFESVNLGSISRSGELAILSDGNRAGGGSNLSRAPMNGGAPLGIAQHVSWVDWSHDGNHVFVIRPAGNRWVVEMPIDHVVFSSAGSLTHLRVSPDGTSAGLLEHPVRGDDAGSVILLDSNGHARSLSTGWASIGGLAWHPQGREIWFTAAKTGAVKSLWAVSLDGSVRQVAGMPGPMTLHDVSADGRVLIAGGMRRTHMLGMLNGDSTERDLSLFDWSAVEDISSDGNLLLFDESGEAGGANRAVYLRNARAGTTVRLGEGRAGAISPDQRWTAVMDSHTGPDIIILPIVEGAPRKISTGGIRPSWVRIFPDGRRLLITGSEKDKNASMFVLPLDGRPITPLNDFLRNAVISPDGSSIAGADLEGRINRIPATGGPRVLIGHAVNLLPIVWCADGRSILVHHAERGARVRISKMDVETGRLQPWRELTPADPVGFFNVPRLHAAANEKAYAYTFLRTLSELYVVDGWR